MCSTYGAPGIWLSAVTTWYQFQWSSPQAVAAALSVAGGPPNTLAKQPVIPVPLAEMATSMLPTSVSHT